MRKNQKGQPCRTLTRAHLLSHDDTVVTVAFLRHHGMHLSCNTNISSNTLAHTKDCTSILFSWLRLTPGPQAHCNMQPLLLSILPMHDASKDCGRRSSNVRFPWLLYPLYSFCTLPIESQHGRVSQCVRQCLRTQYCTIPRQYHTKETSNDVLAVLHCLEQLIFYLPIGC